MKKIMKTILITITLALCFFSCDILFPPETGCCVSNNDDGDWPTIESPVCFENVTFDDCKANSFDSNGFYINQACSEAYEYCD